MCDDARIVNYIAKLTPVLMNPIGVPMFLFSPLGSFPPTHLFVGFPSVRYYSGHCFLFDLYLRAGLKPAPTIMGLIDYWKTYNLHNIYDTMLVSSHFIL